MRRFLNKELSLNFIGCLTKKGYKHRALKFFFFSLGRLRSETVEFLCLNRVINNVRPFLILKPYKMASVTYKLPVPLNFFQSYSRGIRNLVKFAKKRGELNFETKLMHEMFDAYENISNSIFFKEDIYEQALEGRLFLYFFKRKKKKQRKIVKRTNRRKVKKRFFKKRKKMKIQLKN